MVNLLAYFFDPVLRGPNLGSMFICGSAALIGVMVFFKRKSLIGETLSHACFPGVLLGLLIQPDINDFYYPIFFAFIISLMAYFLTDYLKRFISEDNALSFNLSFFFGLGILLLSLMQFSHGFLAKRAEAYIYGQSATMTDSHIYLFFIVFSLLILLFFIFYQPIKISLFDDQYAKTSYIPTTIIELIFSFLLVFIIILGIRAVGVVLMSGTLIAPVITSRHLSKTLSSTLIIAALIGLTSAFLGNIVSYEGSKWYATHNQHMVLPTGPTIILFQSIFAIVALLLSPTKGYLIRRYRLLKYRLKYTRENILKYLWHNNKASTTQLSNFLNIRTFHIILIINYLRWQKLIQSQNNNYYLTPYGVDRAAYIVRLHRLWEVYLVELVGKGKKEVHTLAEEMEHVITKEIEQELTKILNNPQFDPHNQPIPNSRYKI